MRICFIAHQGTTEGVGLFLLDQIDWLLKKQVSLVAILPERGPLADALGRRGVEFEIVESPWWIKNPHHGRAWDHTLALESARKMAALFQKWAVDLVYTQTVVAPAGPMAAALANKPHIWHIHEFSYNPDCIDMAIPQPALARLIDLTSNAVVFNSNAVASEWEKWLPSAKTKLVRNWVPPSPKTSTPDLVDGNGPPQLQFGSEQFVIAIVASIIPWKRQLDAVRAVAQLTEEKLNVVLLMIGPTLDEKYLNTIKDYVKERNLQERVRYLGYLDNPSQIMKLAKAIVVCSELEPFGRVTVESMACGVPVIGAKSGGTVEIIEDGLSGFLFPPRDVEALAAQLRLLIQDETLRQTVGRNALKRSELFNSADREMTPLLDLFKSLAGAKNPSWPIGELVAMGIPPGPFRRKRPSVGATGKGLAKKIYRRLRG